MATDNTAVVRQFIEEVWNKGNLKALDDLVSDKYVGVEPVLGEIRGLDALRQQVQGFRTAFPDLRVTIEDMGVAGDRVFTRWTARGTHRGSFMGIAPTNKASEIRGIALDRIAGGKIVESQQSYDTLALFQGLGVVPPVERLMKGQQAGAEATPRA